MDKILVALAGAPNVGKSTLFNTLVGEKRHVGNWPGKTVEKYEGELRHHDKIIRIVDLPGTYSLGAISEEEVIAREFIVKEKPDVVVVIVNAIELEQSLYLAIQVLELYEKVVIAVNKMDAARKRGIHINFSRLSKLLGVPVVGISAINKEGIHQLVEAILDVVQGKTKVKRLKIDYNGLLYYVKEIEEKVKECGRLEHYPLGWAAIRLLEGDHVLEDILRKSGCEKALKYIEETRKRIEKELGSSPELIAISARYETISHIVSSVQERTGVAKPEFTEKLDSILLHPQLGPIISTLLIISIIFLVFSVNTGFPLNIIFNELGYTELATIIEENSLASLLSNIFGIFGDVVRSFLEALGVSDFVVSLIVDGIIVGIGSVLSFFPLIFMVFIAFSFLEDSGLLSRFAVIGHNFANKMGLTGKALLPLLLGIGCNVPAIIGTRILESDEEKLLANMLAPLIPCQARLVVILMFAAAFFRNPVIQTLIVVFLYVYAAFLFIVLSRLFRKILLKKYEPPEIIIELPPYHKPSLRVMWWYAWDHSVHFLKKAGTIILALSIVLWYVTNYGPAGPAINIEESYAAMLGKLLLPVTSLIGLPDWRIALAFETGFIAKEGLVETLVLTTGIDDPVLAVRSLGLTIPQIIAFLVAMDTYTPCIPTLAAFYEEVRNKKYLVVLLVYELILALVSGMVIFHLFELLL